MKPIQPRPTTQQGNTERPEYKHDIMPSRSTYTPTNAKRFKDVFDAMLQSRQNQVVLSSEVGLRPSTLHVAAQDALRWLQDHDEKGAEYTNLRSSISIRKTTEGIFIYFKNTLKNLQAREVGTDMSSRWKEELVKWLETAQSGEMFVRENILVTDEQKEWVINLLAPIEGVEVEVEINKIRVMR